MTTTNLDSRLVSRLTPRDTGNVPVSLARLMTWTARHDGVEIYRIGCDYFIATCPAAVVDVDELGRRIVCECTEISDPIRTYQDARDWLNY